MPGIANVRLNRSPYDSMIVRIRMMKPQNVAKCAIPGTVHFSSFRCPNTSTTWDRTSPAGFSRTIASRSGAGWPLAASRYSHHSRRPASANATAVRARPMMMRWATATS